MQKEKQQIMSVMYLLKFVAIDVSTRYFFSIYSENYSSVKQLFEKQNLLRYWSKEKISVNDVT